MSLELVSVEIKEQRCENKHKEKLKLNLRCILCNVGDRICQGKLYNIKSHLYNIIYNYNFFNYILNSCLFFVK